MKRILIWLVVIPVIAFFSRCATEPEKQYLDFLVKVDSIKHLNAVSLNDTISVRFYGTVSNDGCSGFSHFESREKPMELDLRVWAKREVFGGICPDVMVYLDGREYKFHAKERGVLRLNIYQPGGSILTDSLVIF